MELYKELGIQDGMSEPEIATLLAQHRQQCISLLNHPDLRMQQNAQNMLRAIDRLISADSKLTAKADNPDDPEKPIEPDEPGKTEDPTEPEKPHLTVTKVTTSKAKAADGKYALGETITYKVTVTNDGNVTIVDITVTDELTSDSWKVESLAPNEAKDFTTSHVVTEADIKAGKVINEATAKGVVPGDPENPDDPDTPAETSLPTQLYSLNPDRQLLWMYSS